MPVDCQCLIVDHRYTAQDRYRDQSAGTGEVRPVRERDER